VIVFTRSVARCTPPLRTPYTWTYHTIPCLFRWRYEKQSELGPLRYGKMLNSENTVCNVFVNGFIWVFECEIRQETTFWESRMERKRKERKRLKQRKIYKRWLASRNTVTKRKKETKKRRQWETESKIMIRMIGMDWKNWRRWSQLSRFGNIAHQMNARSCGWILDDWIDHKDWNAEVILKYFHAEEQCCDLNAIISFDFFLLNAWSRGYQRMRQSGVSV
jgi:hypothetical protein